MAPRKKLQTEPILDGPPPELDLGRTIHAMSEQQLNNVIRVIKKESVDKTGAIGRPAHIKLMELDGDARDQGLTPIVPSPELDLDLIPEGIPDGSDQFDPGSIITWINKIQLGDDESIYQLSVIDATYRSRNL